MGEPLFYSAVFRCSITGLSVHQTRTARERDAITEQSNVNEVSHLTDQTLLEDQNMAVVQMSEATAEKLEAKHSVISVEKTEEDWKKCSTEKAV